MRLCTWEWDNISSVGYNIIGKLETTLENLGILSEYASITATEEFDLKYSSYQWSDDEKRNIRNNIRTANKFK